jgi:hypothetical protein
VTVRTVRLLYMRLSPNLQPRRESAMNDDIDRIGTLLHEAAETHHQVYRITDGTDEDWASWYSDWLTRLSELPDLLDRKPVRSELTHQLVVLDREYSSTSPPPEQSWEQFYAQRISQVFS